MSTTGEAILTVGACIDDCVDCPRKAFEGESRRPDLEATVSTMPVRDALDWDDELTFFADSMSEDDLAKIGEDLGISSSHAKALILCAIKRVMNKVKEV